VKSSMRPHIWLILRIIPRLGVEVVVIISSAFTESGAVRQFSDVESSDNRQVKLLYSSY
jgi:hypothetical protein